VEGRTDATAGAAGLASPSAPAFAGPSISGDAGRRQRRRPRAPPLGIRPALLRRSLSRAVPLRRRRRPLRRRPSVISRRRRGWRRRSRGSPHRRLRPPRRSRLRRRPFRIPPRPLGGRGRRRRLGASAAVPMEALPLRVVQVRRSIWTDRAGIILAKELEVGPGRICPRRSA